jgi:5'-deoxynucleotidase YfbR-like HD superfamily hydrolase
MGYGYDFCRYALTHDFHEAIVRDVPTPIKEAIGEAWYRVEDTVAKRLANYFEYPILTDLTIEEQEEFKKLDKDFAKYEWMMFIENQIDSVPEVIRSSIVSVLGIERKDLIIRVAETFLNLP